MSHNGYFQMPTIYQKTVIFVTDDDLWSVELDSEIAPRRLTSARGQVRNPRISPDGKWVAYLANEQGAFDIYLMPIHGGDHVRLTYTGVFNICDWKNNNTLLFSSDSESFHRKHLELFEIDINTLKTKELNLGNAYTFSYGKGGHHVLGRNTGDPARWKRYRGGTAGILFVDQTGKNSYKQILKNLKTNLTNPLWIDDRIYFISDHEGVGNIYSCNMRGTSLRKVTNHKNYYVRKFNHHNGTIVYQCAGDLYTYNLKTKKDEKLELNFSTAGFQAEPRFVSAERNLQDFAISIDAKLMSFISRGKHFLLYPWKSAPWILSTNNKERHKLTCWAKDQLVSVVVNERCEEEIRLYDSDSHLEKPVRFNRDWGKIAIIQPSPNGKYLAISNNRNQLFIADLSKNSATLIDKSHENYFDDLTWSHDSQYLAYKAPYSNHRQGIKVYSTSNSTHKFLVNPIMEDSSPTFSPCGNYLYFIGIREFHPTYNETHFDLGFPFASRPYVVVLNKEAPLPFDRYHEVPDEDNDDKGKKENKCTIHFEGIENRVYALHRKMGGYYSMFATTHKVFYLKSKVIPMNPNHPDPYSTVTYNLFCYDFKEKKEDIIQHDVYDYRLSRDNRYVLYECSSGVRIVDTGIKPGDGELFNIKDGWIDIEQVKFKVNPKEEWEQIYAEAWAIQKEHFWVEDMSKINWEDVYIKYWALLEKINTRFEFSDLMWEMQGELGTSHAYEFGGDYHKRAPFHPVARLGAKLSFNETDDSYSISEVYSGDSWIDGHNSPLHYPLSNLKKGDSILAVDGLGFESPNSIYEHLDGKAGKRVNLTIRRRGSSTEEHITVPTLRSHTPIHYREWVEKNKKYVHEKSKGKLGYVHIPNMMVEGYSEFYRHYLSEHQYDGIVIDVRFNGGGHVSQHLLKVLAQKVIGYDLTRWFDVEKYPMYAPGALVCLTNEQAGSDGDIFSHSFKLMGLGKLIGKRTWGGVIGISPRHVLNDGTMTTQPEYSFWFKDVGWNVENYGTDPDIEVDYLPQDYKKGIDPQLDRAIEEGLKAVLKTKKLKFDREKRPNLGAH